MKKLISLFLCINFLSLQGVFAFVDVFEDELANSLNKNLKIEKIQQKNLEDEFALKFLDSSLKIKNNQKVLYNDFLVEKNLNPNLKIKNKKIKPVEDSAIKLLTGKEIKKEIKNTKITFSDKSTKIKIKPLQYYTTRKNLVEGDYINFELAQDTNIFNKTYKSGSQIKARVENVSLNQAYGVPADVVIGNFILNDKVNLDGEISITGANRALWVYPVGYTLTMLLGVGIFVFPIRGGHAKFKTNKIYEFEVYE